MGRTGTFIALAVMVLVGVLGGLASWASSGNATRAVEVTYDRFVSTATGHDPFTRCYTAKRLSNSFYTHEIVFDHELMSCYQPLSRIRGIYVDEFEGGAFLEGIQGNADIAIPCENPVELSFRSQRIQGAIAQGGGTTRLWLLDFEGRKTPEWPYKRTFVPLTWGGSNKVIVVEHIYSRRLLAHVPRITVSCDNPH